MKLIASLVAALVFSPVASAMDFLPKPAEQPRID